MIYLCMIPFAVALLVVIEVLPPSPYIRYLRRLSDAEFAQHTTKRKKP